MIPPSSESYIYVLFEFLFTDADCHQISKQKNATSDDVGVYLHRMLPEVPTGIKARSRYEMAC